MAKTQAKSGKITIELSNVQAEKMYNGLRELDGTVTEKQKSLVFQPHIFYGDTVFLIARNRRTLEPIVETFQASRNNITAKHANAEGQVPAANIAAYNTEVKPVLEAKVTVELDLIPKKSLQLKETPDDEGNDITPGVIAAIYDIIAQ